MCWYLFDKTEKILNHPLNISVRDKNFLINGLNDKRWKGTLFAA